MSEINLTKEAVPFGTDLFSAIIQILDSNAADSVKLKALDAVMSRSKVNVHVNNNHMVKQDHPFISVNTKERE